MVISFTILLFSCFLFQVILWCFIFKPLGNIPSIKTNESERVPIKTAIIICINKTEPTLTTNLTKVLRQKIHDYEVIIVKNGDDPDLDKVLNQLKEEYVHLKVLHLPKEWGSNKKKCLQLALAHVGDQSLLLTDADCFPASESWLHSMVETSQVETADIVLGYSPYLIEDNSLLQRWIHYEGLITGIQYLSMARIGLPYMGVGRNVFYSPFVLGANVIQQNIDLLSGDDDLSINHLKSKHKITINLDPNAFVYTFPKSSWLSYAKQKVRHYSTSHRYTLFDIFLLCGVSFSHALFYVSLVFLICYKAFQLAAVVYIIRMALCSMVFKKLADRLKSPLNWKHFIFFDFIHVIYFMIFAFFVIFPKKSKW